MKRILVTGATGFIGKNLIEQLNKMGVVDIDKFSSKTSLESLRAFSSRCDFVYHLAAIHRPPDEIDFFRVNVDLTGFLLDSLRVYNNRCPVLLSSSIQACDGSAYGTSKLAAEELLKKHATDHGSPAIIYRLTNTFGRYARPYGHSVVSTFCHNVARGLPIVIHDPNRVMQLYYIDDVINVFLAHLDGWVEPDADGFYRLPESLKYEITLGALAEKINSFKEDYDRNFKTSVSDGLTAKLHATFLSYLP